MLEEMLIVAAAVLAPFALYGLYVHLRRAPAPKPAGRKTVSPPPREAGQEPTFTPEAEQQYDPSSFVDDELKPVIVRSPGAPAPAEPESQPASQPDPAPPPAPAAAARPAAVAEAEDEFPQLDGSKLQELYYYLVRMQFKQDIDATAIHQLATSIEDEVRLRRHQTVLGYSLKNGQWETPRPGNSYRHLVWGVPVCNRASKLGGDALPQLVRAIQGLMRKYKGVAHYPAKADVEQRMEQVEEFCQMADKRVDALLVAVATEGGVAHKGGDVVDLALAEGLEEIDGELRRQVNGETWYTLTNGKPQELTSKSPDRRIARLVASIDFPHVSDPLAAFDEMFKLASKLARVLRFDLVDADGTPLDEEGIQGTREDVRDLIDYMRDHGVPPGSKLARALFSR